MEADHLGGAEAELVDAAFALDGNDAAGAFVFDGYFDAGLNGEFFGGEELFAVGQYGGVLRLGSFVAENRKAARRRRIIRPAVEAIEPRVMLSTSTVTSGADAGAGSLRNVLAAASPGDTIDFAAAIREVDLTSAGLTLSQNVTIVNDLGTGPVTVNGGNLYTVFTVSPGVTASISGLTVTAGSGTSGGGVDNNGTLTLTNDTVSSNTASNIGGGVYNNNSATLTLIDDTLSGNTAGSGGGAINFGGTLTLNGCTVSGNSWQEQAQPAASSTPAER